MNIRRFAPRAASATIGLLLAGSLLAGPAMAQSAFTSLDRAPEARVSFAAPARGTPILAGSTVQLSGQGFHPGQQVRILHGSTPLAGGDFTADAEGKISGQIQVPADAVAGTHPLVVVATGPYSASIANLKVSPTVPLSGQANYQITEGNVARGLYQSARSAKNNVLFVTSSVGRPPVRQSELLKLDPGTLAVLARATPPALPEQPAPRAGEAAGEVTAGPALFAVYGIGVDDGHDNIWVTNTRQNTVAVYKQSDLSLVKQFAPGTVPHSRDVVVDAKLGKAYVSSIGTPNVVVFDTARPDVLKTVAIPTKQRGAEFSPFSMSLDRNANRLYVVSMPTNEVAVLDTRTDTVLKTLPVPGVSNPIGISHDPETGRIFVAAQGSDNLVVLDGDSGAVIADTPVGAGALNVVFDPATRHAYVTNRGAGTIAVTDADGKLLANLGPAPLANHVSLGPDGVVFVVDKSSGASGEESDTLLRITPRR